MNNPQDQSPNKTASVRQLFDDTLSRHLDRLLGTRFGIENLPLNCLTLTCLILLAEREKEILDLPPDGSRHYTLAALDKELSEMGFHAGTELDRTVHEMTEKGYFHGDDGGRLSAGKPALSMARLVDLAFPGMPGMNLIAYLIQTMNEVLTERKDLASAISQFDQILMMQGVTVKKQAALYETRRQPRGMEQKPPELNKGFQEETPKIISSHGGSKGLEIRKITFGKPVAVEEETPTSPDVVGEEYSQLKRDISSRENRETSTDAMPVEEPLGPMETPPQDPSEDISDSQEEHQDQADKEGVFISVQRVETGTESEEQEEGWDSIGSSEISKKSDIPPDADDSQATHDTVDSRVAAFEQDLAMQCPVCRSATIEAVKTALGKTYYKCPGKTCNFISWGKPYHLICPRCQNPFLVEVADQSGQMILKCPRATCRNYRGLDQGSGETPSINGTPTLQGLNEAPKPRKRLVRRKVARRKR